MSSPTPGSLLHDLPQHTYTFASGTVESYVGTTVTGNTKEFGDLWQPSSF
ncbi:hypothetical protein ACFO25_02235 [Paenactinomyces guangxiensis]|uniref:Uncharacterized protein n=1 Tax=Paenactinomyces guangxiensis TaxID=1490290 RepID=A0A7W1WUP9_9BACL|nr:hypothetical protein [Paenactinomyces guangxiensis]MBA4496394.1 hypothetical protein [Paenactinomyces guangxiensis]MBH8593492.1 hypothetical protein [Paenactinomyces guangxiensis]